MRALERFGGHIRHGIQRYDMHVDMRHMKPDDEQPHFRRLIEVCQAFPKTMGELHERAIQRGCQAVKVRLVAFGHDQDMPRIQGPMVQKGQEVLVFIDGMAGDMPRRNCTRLLLDSRVVDLTTS